MLNFPGYKIFRKIYESDRSLVYRGVRSADAQPAIFKILKQDYIKRCLTCWVRQIIPAIYRGQLAKKSICCRCLRKRTIAREFITFICTNSYYVICSGIYRKHWKMQLNLENV
ncbi:hypothetical protein QUB68_23220 [Microcoleus sp. A006_D1]|uniref:hypothetical protein n=1 Tax=Microcoleus sp. A006_D1 TaxID=3055267 RepID=UPI002FD07EDA